LSQNNYTNTISQRLHGLGIEVATHMGTDTHVFTQSTYRNILHNHLMSLYLMSLKIHAWLIRNITLMNEIYRGYGSVIEAWFIDSPDSLLDSFGLIAPELSPSNCMSRT